MCNKCFKGVRFGYKNVALLLLQEFIAVRVQDPRLQNEGSWNSYVDFKIFLHVSIFASVISDNNQM